MHPPSSLCGVLLAMGLLTGREAFSQGSQPASVRPADDLAGVHIDTPGDGNVWVLAPGYKARFGTDGVEYFPYFGPKADRLYPVSFRVREVRRGELVLPCRKDAPPRVVGDRVCFDRGGVLEVWDLRRVEVEQTFVLTEFAGTGDLVVQLDVRSDLAASDVADGLRFAHPRWGCVHYGDVVAFDAAGQRCTSPATLGGAGIELRVPAAFVDGARGALTVDPIVRAIGVDSGSTSTLSADVAFEPNTGNWLVAYAREFATTDSDIITRRFNSAGDFLEEVVVATGNRESRNPAVGANGPAGQFLIVWDEDIAIANRVILGRTRAAASTAQGATFTVLDTPGLGKDDLAPQVGGSIANDGTGGNYAVLCMSDNDNGRHASFVRVSTSGAATRLGTASAIGHDVADVRIARTRRNGESFVGAYLARSGSVRHLHATQMDGDGLPIRSQPVDTAADCDLGGIAGRGTNYFVAYARTGATGGSDIFGATLFVSANAFSSGTPTNLTAREPGAVAALDQLAPTLAFDGCRYTYAYQEAAGAAGSFDLFAAVLSIPDLVFSDGHRPLHSATAARETEVTMASTGDMGGALARSFLVFERLDNGDVDIGGVLFDGTAFTGGVIALRTGCGTLDLTALNEPILGASLELRATSINPAAQLFLVGLPTAPLRLCASTCMLGVTPILFTTLGATLTLPIPSRSNLVGGELAVQNVLIGGTGGCAPPATPVALVTSPTLRIVVR